MAFSPVQKLSIGTGISLVVLALVGLVAYSSITQMMGGQKAVTATNANIAHLDRVMARTLDGENAEREYVASGDSLYLQPLDEAQSDVEFALDALRAASEDNPQQRRALDSLAPLVSNRFLELRAAVTVRQRFGADSARKLVRRVAPRANAGARSLALRMRDEELRVLGERTRTMTARGLTASRFIFGGAMFALLFALVALQPLRPGVAERLQRRLSTTRRSSAPVVQLTPGEEARHAGDRLVRLQRLIAALDGPVSASDVARQLLARGAPPLVGSLGIVAVTEGDHLRVLRVLGDAVEHLAPGSILPAALHAPFDDAIRSHKPLLVESRDDRQHRFGTLGRFSYNGTSDGAFAAVPLMSGDSVMGVLLLAFADNRKFSDDESDYLSTLGRIGGQAFARAAQDARR